MAPLSCLRPIGANRVDGRTILRHTLLDARLSDGQYLEIACRDCDACRAKRCREWAIRSHHETLDHTRVHNGQKVPNGCFITLTYNDDHLPDDGSLRVRDFQLFLKKLRNRSKQSIRYLHCGEYGTEGTKRPHYHACLYGIDFHQDRYEWSCDPETGFKQWRSPTLEALWSDEYGPIGFCTLSPLNFALSSYTAGYVFKKLKYQQQLEDRQKYVWQDQDYYDEEGLVRKLVPAIKPEYITMSRRPGLGQNWLWKNLHTVYPRDRVYVDGKEFHPPAYYDRLLEQWDPVLYDQVMEQRQNHVEELGPTTALELRARGEIFAARFNTNTKRRDKVQ